MPLTDATKVSISVPLQDTDKVIGVFSGSIATSAPSAIDGYIVGSATHTTGFGESCYAKGIFSVDGGTTWNDMGSMIPDNTGGPPPSFQTQECIWECSPTGVITARATNWYNFITSSSAAKTFTYKLALIAKNDQGNITPLPTNSVTAYSSADNYQKIHDQGSTAWNVTPGTDKTATVAHGLGYIPKVKAFYRKTDGTILPLIWNNVVTPAYFEVEVRITSTTITFFMDGFRSTFHPAYTGYIDWRIYLDA